MFLFVTIINSIFALFIFPTVAQGASTVEASWKLLALFFDPRLSYNTTRSGKIARSFQEASTVDLESSSRNPGFAIRISPKALKFLSSFSRRSLTDWLTTGKAYGFKGVIAEQVNFELSDWRIRKYTKGYSSDIVIQPGFGLEWRIRDLTLDTDAEYRIRYGRIATSGAMRLKVYRMTIVLLLSSQLNKAGLEPSLEDCQVYISVADVQFNGGVADRVLQGLGIDKDMNKLAKTFLQQNLCRGIQLELLPQLTKRLLNIPDTMHLFDQLYIDYSLTQRPNYGEKYVTTLHDGKVFAILTQNGRSVNLTSLPFQPTALQMSPPRADRMVYVDMSNYTVASLMYWLTRAGVYDIDFTRGTVGEEYADFLSTTCPAGDVCAGNMFPTLGELYPDSTVGIFVKGASHPVIIPTIGQLNITSPMRIDGFVLRTNGSRERIFTAESLFHTVIKRVAVKEDRMTGKLDYTGFDILKMDSRIKEFDQASLDFIITGTSDTLIKPRIENSLGAGLRIPRLLNFPMVNWKVDFLENVVSIGTDFCSNEDECRAARAKASLLNAPIPTTTLSSNDYYNNYEG